MPSNNSTDLSTSITLSHPQNSLVNPRSGGRKDALRGEAFSGPCAVALHAASHHCRTSSPTTDSFVEPLQVIVRSSPELGNKNVYLGVIGRLVCDYGLQLAEHIVFQSYILLNSSSSPSQRPKWKQKDICRVTF